jgi:ATP-dependent DNA helicase RecQ
MYKDAFRINSANLQLRKEKNKARMLAMINYTLDGQQCRSVMIGRYFNDLEIKPCGICDHCIQQKEMVISPDSRLPPVILSLSITADVLPE